MFFMPVFSCPIPETGREEHFSALAREKRDAETSKIRKINKISVNNPLHVMFCYRFFNRAVVALWCRKKVGTMASINQSIRNLVVMCIDRKDGLVCSGRLYHRYRLEPIRFSSMEEAQIRMDMFYDELGFPQNAAGSSLLFGKKATERKEMTVMQENEAIAAKKGDIATFVIHVQHRQNATWQGNIIWADNKTESTFRSALEMLKLMYMALDSIDDIEEE